MIDNRHIFYFYIDCNVQRWMIIIDIDQILGWGSDFDCIEWIWRENQVQNIIVFIVEWIMLSQIAKVN